LCSKDDTIQLCMLLRVSECLNRGPWRQQLIWLPSLSISYVPENTSNQNPFVNNQSIHQRPFTTQFTWNSFQYTHLC
jgi:hypothetical protein